MIVVDVYWQFYAFGTYGHDHTTYGPNEELMANLGLNYTIRYVILHSGSNCPRHVGTRQLRLGESFLTSILLF